MQSVRKKTLLNYKEPPSNTLLLGEGAFKSKLKY